MSVPPWHAAWQRAAHSLGADMHEVDSRQGRSVAIQLRSGHVMITLLRPAALVIHGAELRAPFWNPAGIRFDLSPTPLLGRWARPFQRDVSIGDEWLDARYFITTNAPDRVRRVLSAPRIRKLLTTQRRIEMAIRPAPGTNTPAIDEIFIPFRREPTDGRFIQRMFELARRTLRAVLRTDDADTIGEHIRRIEGPGGSLHAPLGDGRILLWEGDVARTAAAQALGRLRDGRALGPLLRALEDPSEALRIVSVRALGRLADERAIEALLPLLGDRDGELTPLGRVAAESLEALGVGPLVEAFEEALSGNPDRLASLVGAHRGPVVVALTRSLTRPHRPVFAHAYRALAALRAVESLPVLRTGLRVVTREEIRRQCEAAIAALEALQSLPRSAKSLLAGRSTLPRPAAPSGADAPSTLPSPAKPGVPPEEGEDSSA